MEVRAQLRYLRMSPKKVRLVINVIRGMDIEEALHQLRFTTKAAAQPVLKLLNSAIANAENNFKLKKENLYISRIEANEGPSLERWKPRAFGRATPISKRSTHISIVLAEKKPTKKAEKKAKVKKKSPEELKVVLPKEIKRESMEERVEKFKKPPRGKKPFIKIKELKDKFIRKTGES